MQKAPKVYTEGKYEKTEISRRLYRSASEAVRKLEEQLRNATSARARMAPEVTLLRTRVKEYCERLLFAAPLEYGRQAEELTWRKVYYEAVQQFKTPKRGVQGNGEGERVKDEEEAVLSLRAHLMSGLGHYHHLLIRLQAEYRLDLESSVDVPLRWSHRGLPRGRLSQRRQQPPHHGHDASGQHEESLVLWARQACHRLLLCLGDLARYLSELGAPGSGERERWALLSQRYYWQALGLDPEAGMPHNQLGTLAGGAHVGCNAAYHYLRCLQSGQPFDGAQGNLLRLLDKNSRLLLEAPHGGNNHLFRFSTHFLKLCEQLYTSTDTNGIQALCEETLAQLSALLAEPEMPTADLVFRAAVMAMLCTEKLRKSGPHPLSSAAAAFTLSLFSHVLAACSRRLAPPATDGPEDPVAPLPLRGPDAAQPDGVADRDSCLDSGEGSGCGSPPCLVPPPGVKLDPEMEQQSVQQSRLAKESRQRITCSPSTSTDEGSTHESSDHSSPTDPWSSHPDSEEGESPLGTATNDSGGDPVRGSGRELLLQLGGEGLLLCIKVLCDWLRGHAEFMGPCAQAAGPLWLHLATLLNVLQRFEELVLATTDGRQAMDRCSDMGAPRGPVGLPGDNWGQGPPLAEDICLRGTVALAKAHAAVDWALQPPSSQALQAWLRLECILQFGQWAANKPGSGLRYCPEERRFQPTAVSANGAVSPGPILGGRSESPEESERKRVMRSMAHLWLEQEVRDLEGQVGALAPPFLVPHTRVLCSQLAHVRRLVATRRFVLVVPSHVISSLDLLKRESVGARESIRWLEGELRRGSRYVRSQKSHERLSLSPMKYPKRKDKEAWELFQILECCHHLEKQCPRGGGQHPPGRVMVTLLTHGEHGLPHNAAALARSAGISMEDIEAFVSKWQTTAPPARTQPG